MMLLLKEQDSMQDHTHAFRERLDRHPGGPWYLNGSQDQPDDQVLQLSEPDPQQRWDEPDVFLDFLDRTHYRQLLWCFIGRNASEKNRAWSLDALQQRTHLSLEDLEEALAFCHRQAFAIPNETRQSRETIFQFLREHPVEGKAPFEPTPEDLANLAQLPEKPTKWYSDSSLDHIRTTGPTFEWIIQTLLEKKYQALARRNVQLSRFQGDVDVLAFLPDGRSVLVECKSSTKNIMDGHFQRFFHKARLFHPDVAVLLMDTEDHQQFQQRELQVPRAFWREYGTWPSSQRRNLSVTSMMRVNPGVFVAISGVRLSATLHFLLNVDRYHLFE
jgi:hypothetical protein